MGSIGCSEMKGISSSSSRSRSRWPRREKPARNRVG